MNRKSTVVRKVNGQWIKEQRQVIKVEWCNETKRFWGRVRMDGKHKRVCSTDLFTWVMPASATITFSSGRTIAKEFANS